jgi:crotonobetainyl-CoA:carnitine CoA-transferase CaiB-like acyl-CoA transferase
MEQISGLAWVTGFADGPPVIPRGPCDPLAGLHATFALLIALEHRRRTGEGQLIESTMVEAALNAAVEQVLTWQTENRLLQRDGNRSPHVAPQNLYACKGTEQWLALSVEKDSHWRALRELMGFPEWASHPELDSVSGRLAAKDRIDGELARWCVHQELPEVVEALLEKGIPAAPVVPAREVDQNPQLRSRGFFEAVTHPITGNHEIPGLPFRFSPRAEPWIRQPAPTLGQHSAQILQALLGLQEESIRPLEDTKVIGERPVGL